MARDGADIAAAMRTSVAIVGAGPAGAVAALRLACAGIDVTLIDKQAWRPRISETLSPEGKVALNRAGLWERIPRGVAAPCPALLSAWERPVVSTHSFMTNPYGCAWHLDREAFDAWLLSEAMAAGARFVVGIARDAIPIARGWSLAVFDAAREIRADYLIIAVGRTGACSAHTGRRRWLDRLCLVGGFTEAAPNSGDFLLVEAVPSGWWYSAPYGNRLFAGWMTDTHLLPKRAGRFDAMEAALRQAPFTERRMASAPPPCVVLAATAVRRPLTGKHWVAVGDAALSRDPLSGDGLASAIRSGWEGAGTIIDAMTGDEHAWTKASMHGEAMVEAYFRRRAAAYRAQPRWASWPFWVARQETQFS